MPQQADFQDAFDIAAGVIMVNGEQWGWVSGVTIDARRPEEFVSVIGGQLRRRKPEEVDWSVDNATLYDNIGNLKALKNVLFDIVLIMTNPDPNAPADNKSQKLIIRGCRISDENITISDSSTFRCNGRAKTWEIDTGA